MSEKYISLDCWFIRDNGTTMQEKLIYSEISQLTMLKRGCVASNEHFSKLLDIKKSSVSRTISSLETKGYIKTEITGGSRNHERKIFVNKMLFKEIFDNRMLLEGQSLITKCYETKGNNTKDNNTLEEKKGKFKKPTEKEVANYMVLNSVDHIVDSKTFFSWYESKGWKGIEAWEPLVDIWVERERNKSGFDLQPNKTEFPTLETVKEQIKKKLKDKDYEIQNGHIKGIWRSCCAAKLSSHEELKDYIEDTYKSHSEAL